MIGVINMPLVAAKCTECGSSIEVDDTKEAGICSHCGTAFITEKVINNYVSNYNITNNVTKIYQGGDMEDSEDLFQKGLTYLQLNKFDFAADSFDQAIEKDPKVAKNYLYWTIAVSNNFKTLPVFFNFNKKYDYNLDDFYALANKEELQQLSSELGIELTKGEDIAKLEILKKVLSKKENIKINTEFLEANYSEILSKYTPQELETIKDASNEYILWLTMAIENNTDLVNKLYKTNIAYGLAPGYENVSHFTDFSKEEINALLSTDNVAQVANKKNKEIARQNKQEKYRRNKRIKNRIVEGIFESFFIALILGAICGAIAMVIKGIIHLFKEGQGIIKAFFHIFSSESFNIGLTVLIISFGVIFVGCIIKTIVNAVNNN